MDDLSEFELRPKPTADRPLLGLTVLAVEDSRYASEALRLLCLRSGARIRRADSLGSARRHLAVYRPSVAIVDLGLPDGSGLDLIGELRRTTPRVPVILGTSGAERHAAAADALAAGADGFLPKPLESLATFQLEILRHLPGELHPKSPREVAADPVTPDALAYREDLSHAMSLLDLDSPPVAYLRPFLLGVARVAHDTKLEAVVRNLGPDEMPAADRLDLRGLLSDRIARVAVV